MVGPTPRDVLLWWPHVPGRLHCILGKVVVILFLFSFFCAYTNTNNFGIFASLIVSSSSCCPILNNWEEEWERWGRSAFFVLWGGHERSVWDLSIPTLLCISSVHHSFIYQAFSTYKRLTNSPAIFFLIFIYRGGGYGLQHSFSFMSHSEGLLVD